MPEAGAPPPVGRPLRLAFVVDPLPALKAAKDSTVAMMRAAMARGHAVFAIDCATLHWRGPGAGSPEGVCGDAVELTVHADDGAWYATREGATMPLAGFDAVLMRKDPPFDFEYLAATWLLERAEADGARIFNRPRALRDHSEKLAITEFPQFAPPTLVDRDAARLDAFIDAQGDAILKPLDGMGGSRIFRVRHDDPNRNVIVETLTEDGHRTVMAERYLPAIAKGELCRLPLQQLMMWQVPEANWNKVQQGYHAGVLNALLTEYEQRSRGMASRPRFFFDGHVTAGSTFCMEKAIVVKEPNLQHRKIYLQVRPASSSAECGCPCPFSRPCLKKSTSRSRASLSLSLSLRHARR